MDYKYDLAWGDPYFLLELLDKTANSGFPTPIEKCTYAPDLGNEKLLEHIKSITKRCTGNNYRYFCITNGATQALNSCIRQMGQAEKAVHIVTSKFGYPYYPHMVDKTHRFVHKRVDFSTYKGQDNELYIVDSPSNPLGEQSSFNYKNVIWDAVYHNRIYNACPVIQPKHEVFVGSFSKLLGLTGARVGWLATNDLETFQKLFKDTLYENATISRVSQQYVLNILKRLDLERFVDLGRNYLDMNRHMLHGLHNLTQQDVQEKGMFYCFNADKKMIDILDKASVRYVVFNTDNGLMVRLNMGQTGDVLNKAVMAIKKADRS